MHQDLVRRSRMMKAISSRGYRLWAVSRSSPRDTRERTRVTRVSRVLILALGLGCVCSICRADEAIGTTDGTYILSDLNSLVDATARQSADRTAQLALAGVAADAASEENELKSTQEKIAVHNKAADQFNQDLNAYNSALNAYNAKLTPHNAQVAQYDSEVTNQRAQVAQSNNLPTKQRSQANVNRLNQWKTKLDKKKAELNQEKADLDSQKAVLDQKAQAINSRSQTLNDESTQLNTEAAAIKIKLEEAYRQLTVCYNYSVQIKEVLRKDGVVISADDQETLNSTPATLARLKELTKEVANNNAEKASLNSVQGQSQTSGAVSE
jgi:chromosome segregation ATPase